MTQTKPDVQAHIAGIDPTVRPLVEQLRAVVLTQAPALEETIKWRNLFYVRKGNVCAIVPHRAHVNLEFWRGTELPDPQGVLEGTGKAARHVKVRTPEDADSDALTELLRQAVALDG